MRKVTVAKLKNVSGNKVKVRVQLDAASVAAAATFSAKAIRESAGKDLKVLQQFTKKALFKTG